MTKRWIVLAGLGLLLLTGACVERQRREIEGLEARIEFLKEKTVPLRFRLESRVDSNIRVSIKYFDAEGREVAQASELLRGQELHFDFFMVKVADRFLPFPYRLYTDAQAPDDGVMLARHYDREGFPLIYEQDGLDAPTREYLVRLFAEIRLDGGQSLDDESFGSVVHDLEGIKEFQAGRNYAIHCSTKGGVEILEF